MMKCSNHDDMHEKIKEIGKDVKILLAHMNQGIGQEKNDSKRDNKIIVKTTILSVAIPTILGIITLYISKGAS